MGDVECDVVVARDVRHRQLSAIIPGFEQAVVVHNVLHDNVCLYADDRLGLLIVSI